MAKLHLVARSSTGWQPVLGEDRRPVTRPADFSKTHRRPGLACQVVWMGSWRSAALLWSKRTQIGQEGPQNWPRKAPDWSKRTQNWSRRTPKLAKKGPKICQERPIWFCFLAKYAKHVGAGCSGQMWVAFGDLPSMYVLSM